MMPARMPAIVLSLLAYAPTLAASAPFGLHAGDRPPSFSIMRDNGDGTVVLGHVPAYYPGLVQFFARYDEANGLCSVAGATAPFERDKDGIEARSYFQDLTRQLTVKYGEPTLYAFNIPQRRSPRGPGAEPGWVAEIASGSRYHYAFWHVAEDGGSRSVALSIGAEDDDRPFVLLTYDFANFDSCRASLALSAASAL